MPTMAKVMRMWDAHGCTSSYCECWAIISCSFMSYLANFWTQECWNFLAPGWWGRISTRYQAQASLAWTGPENCIFRLFKSSRQHNFAHLEEKTPENTSSQVTTRHYACSSPSYKKLNVHVHHLYLLYYLVRSSMIRANDQRWSNM